LNEDFCRECFTETPQETVEYYFFGKKFLAMRNILRVGKKFTTLIDLHKKKKKLS
jgi:hypothetical protein